MTCGCRAQDEVEYAAYTGMMSARGEPAVQHREVEPCPDCGGSKRAYWGEYGLPASIEDAVSWTVCPMCWPLPTAKGDGDGHAPDCALAALKAETERMVEP